MPKIANPAPLAIIPAMTPAQPILSVRILDGCILCGLCEDTCPQVFSVEADACIVRASADGFFASHAAEIIQSADECPVDVIRVKGHNEDY
jgi:ferredoxin